MYSDQELMEMHSKVLFQHTETGKIRFINEPPYEIAPRVYIGSTKKGKVIRYLDNLNRQIVKDLQHVMDVNSDLPIAEVIQILSRGDQQINNVWIGPAYVFQNVSKVTTNTTKITEANKHYLLPNFPYTYEELAYK